MEAMGDMSWRRFQVLVRCLSPGSATISRLNSSSYIGSSKRERVRTVAGAKAAEAAFQAAFKK